jgi:hypothetical protein
MWIINDSCEIYIIKTEKCNILACRNYTTNYKYSCLLDSEYLDIELLERSIYDSIINNSLIINISDMTIFFNIPISLYIKKQLTIQFCLYNDMLKPVIEETLPIQHKVKPSKKIKNKFDDTLLTGKYKIKKCRECQIKKSITEFNKSKRYLYKAICKKCEEIFSV